MSPDLRKKINLLSDTVKARFFKLCVIVAHLGSTVSYNVDDLDLVSGSQVCQIIKANCVFSILLRSCLKVGRLLHVYIRKIMHSVLCVTGVYLKRDK